MRRERPDHTLQPTAVVHEAFLRLVDQPRVAWQGRAHFFRAAAQIMRNLLVDSARARNAAKRGGGNEHVELDDVRAGTRGPSVDVMALDLALEKLARIDPDRAALVELRFFAGLTFEETAEAMGTSLSTVKRQWNAIRVWLLRELAGTAREATGPLGVQPGQERGAP